MNAHDVTGAWLQQVLLWGLLPVWVAAGLADAWCHRVFHIEQKAGWPESALHLAMLAELGPGVFAAALLEVNALVLVLLGVLCALHEVTMAVDLSYADRQRGIPAVEQWVHGVKQLIPWAGWVALGVIHHEQTGALLGLNAEVPDWTLRWKEAPLPDGAWLLIGLAAVSLGLAFGSEFLRCWKAWRHR